MYLFLKVLINGVNEAQSSTHPNRVDTNGNTNALGVRADTEQKNCNYYDLFKHLGIC